MSKSSAAEKHGEHRERAQCDPRVVAELVQAIRLLSLALENVLPSMTVREAADKVATHLAAAAAAAKSE